MGSDAAMRHGVIGLAALALAGTALAERPVALPGAVHPESISVTPEGTAWVGSMHGGVLKVSLRTGKAVPFVAPGGYGSGALYGVLADARHGLLWTCTNDFPGTVVKVAGADPGHWVKAFDLKTGGGRISLRLPGEHAECNDFAVGADGSVYISDSGLPHILRWRPGMKELQVWLSDPRLGSDDEHTKGGGIDGITFRDGAVFINNYYTGALFRVRVAPGGGPGAITRLTTSRPLGLPDGMRPLPGGDMVVAEGKGRVARLHVTGDAVTVINLAEGLPETTAVGVWGGRVWYTGAQFDALFAPDKVKPTLPFTLTPIALTEHP
jgi:sugar lactone lactonase YvrE